MPAAQCDGETVSRRKSGRAAAASAALSVSVSLAGSVSVPAAVTSAASISPASGSSTGVPFAGSPAPRAMRAACAAGGRIPNASRRECGVDGAAGGVVLRRLGRGLLRGGELVLRRLGRGLLRGWGGVLRRSGRGLLRGGGLVSRRAHCVSGRGRSQHLRAACPGRPAPAEAFRRPAHRDSCEDPYQAKLLHVIQMDKPRITSLYLLPPSALRSFPSTACGRNPSGSRSRRAREVDRRG